MSVQIKSGAVLFAKNLALLARFYEELLSMTMVVSEPDHVVLESDVFQLVVHAISQAIADDIEISVPPELRTEVPVKLFFPVASLAQARLKAQSLGGGLKPEEAQWQARGFCACDGHDPEGNVLQLRELTT
jgi:hypothetical protein